MRSLLATALLAVISSPCLAQNQGLKLINGVDTHIDVKYDKSLVPQSGITLEAWVTYDGSTLQSGWRWPTIARQNPVPQQESFLLRVDAGTASNTAIKWFVRTSGTHAHATWNFTVGQLKAWTHIAGTYDGAFARIFVNGLEVAKAAGSGTILDAGNVLRIGNGDLSSPGAETWNGEIDEVRLWPVARDGAEIQSMMKLDLQRCPGEVSTWNLNGDAKDSSATNHGSRQGQVTFASNTLLLQKTPFAGALGFGDSTAGCNGAPLAGISALPKVGNTNFAVTCIRATRTGTGALMLSAAGRTSPLPLLGAKVWIDPITALAIPAQGDPLAASKTAVPIPKSPWLGSQAFYCQYFWIESGCKVPLFASDGLTISIYP